MHAKKQIKIIKKSSVISDLAFSCLEFLISYYFFDFRLPNPINPTMPATKRRIMTSSGIGIRLIAKMLRVKASAFWANKKK
jgi:hypothetical protein